MRKAARQKDEDWALNVFDRAPFVTMSMIRPDGTLYGLPLSLIRGRGTRFISIAPTRGEKMDCIRANPIVSLSAVSRCSPKFETGKKNFTMYYDSAIALGEAEIVTDNAEKIMALRLLCQRFLPNYMGNFDEAIKRSLNRTTVVKITLTEPPVGKSKP